VILVGKILAFLSIVKNITKTLWKSLLNFVYPPNCILCHERLNGSAKFLCSICENSLQRLQPSFISINESGLLRQSQHWFDASLAVFQYDGKVQHLVHLFKYRNTPQLALFFGKAIGRAIIDSAAMPPIDVLVPVPLHSSRYRERGYNQSALLAHEIAHHTGIPVREMLKRHIRTKQQASKDRYERMKNVSGAFSLIDGLTTEHVSIGLVDDVVTTGSTMNECARVLRAAGARRIIAISVTRIDKDVD